MLRQTEIRRPMGTSPSADWFALVAALERWRPDLIVEVARKMPRIDEALGLGFSTVATTISDLAIPFSASFVRGARVAVVDDSVNVGSTVRRAIEALTSLGASQVRAFALYSRECHQIELSDGAAPLDLVASEPFNPRLGRELSSQAPMIIGRLNKPYDLDFPVIPCQVALPFDDPSSLFARLNVACDRRAFDITIGAGLEIGRHRFSVDLVHRMGRAFEKLRLYYNAVSGELNVVPMRIASPLPSVPDQNAPGWARSLYEALVAAGGDSAEVKARAALFTDSLILGARMLYFLREFVRPTSSRLIDLDEAELIFGPAVRGLDLSPSLVVDSCEPDAFSGARPEAVELPLATSPAWQHLWPEIEAEVAHSGTDPAVRAVATFDTLSKAVGSENPSLYSLKWPYSSTEIERDPYLRLRIGFTAGDLCAILRAGAQTPRDTEGWVRTTSKILDTLIDAGIVVPTIANYSGQLFRVYRKGEAEPRDETIDRILRGMEEYGGGMSRTRVSKVGVIAALAVPTASAAHVSTAERGNVLALDRDLLDDEAEIFGVLRRTGRVVRKSDSGDE